MPLFILFLISILAETNRHPFDLPEAEAELVSGYNVEYSSMGFAYYFIAEYANIIFMCMLCSILFLGGWNKPINWLIMGVMPLILWIIVKMLILILILIDI